MGMNKDLMSRWLAYGKAMQKSGSDLLRHLIADTEQALAAAEQAQQAEPVQTGHCAACNIETGTIRPCDICGVQTVAAQQQAVAGYDAIFGVLYQMRISTRHQCEEAARRILCVLPKPPAVADRDAIRRVFMAHGFTIKEGQTDLKPYVYEAAEALLRELSPAVAVPDGCVRVPVEPTREMLAAAWEYHGSAAYNKLRPDAETDAECYRAMLAAAPLAAVAVPSGYALVPIVANDRMREAGRIGIQRGTKFEAKLTPTECGLVWAYMVGAAAQKGAA